MGKYERKITSFFSPSHSVKMIAINIYYIGFDL